MCLRVPVRVYIYMCICVSVCMYARARAYMCEYVCIRFLNPSGLISLECMRHVCANVIVCACAKLAFIAIVDVSSKISSAYRFDFRGHNASKLIVRFDFRFSLSLSLSLTYTHTHSLSLSLSLSSVFLSMDRMEKRKSFKNPSLEGQQTSLDYVSIIFPAMVCRDAFLLRIDFSGDFSL